MSLTSVEVAWFEYVIRFEVMVVRSPAASPRVTAPFRVVAPLTVSVPESWEALETVKAEVDARVETARMELVAWVEVEKSIFKFVIVEVAELIKMPSEVVSGVKYAPWSVQFEDPPPPTQVPFTAKQPVDTLMPFAKVEVPAPPITMTPVVSITPSVVVAIPTPSPPMR